MTSSRRVEREIVGEVASPVDPVTGQLHRALAALPVVW